MVIAIINYFFLQLFPFRFHLLFSPRPSQKPGGSIINFFIVAAQRMLKHFVKNILKALLILKCSIGLYLLYMYSHDSL